MRKLLIGIGVILALLVVAVVAAPFMVPKEWVTRQIVDGVKSATGRDLTIKGAVSVSAIPSLAVDIRDVHFANAAGAKNKEMAALGSLKAELKWLPLLGGKIEVDTFVLVDPTIHLEVDKQGKPNWVFGDGKETAAKSGGSGGAPKEISLGDVRIENGLLTYDDARSGAGYKIEKLNVKLDLPTLDGPFKGKGDLVYNAKKIDLGVDVGKLRDLMDGRSTAVSLTLGGEPLKLAFKGNAATGAALKVDGDVDLSVPSVKALAAWAGSPIEARDKTMGPLAIKGKVAVDGSKYSFTNASIDIDEIKSKGQLTVDTSGAKPSLKGALDIAALDLNPYLPPESKEKPAQQGATDWSTDPIDLSGLKAADADFNLSVGSLKVRKISIGKSVLGAVLKGGRLQLDLKEMALYEGTGTGRIVLDGSGAVPGTETALKIQNVQLEPLLKDAADNSKLSGKGSFDVTTTGRGKSQKDIISSLAGNGSIDFRDGAIKGFDLAEIVQMARDIKGAVTGAGTGETKKTDFSEVTATFKIVNGIVQNDDMQMKSPLLRVTGKGTVEMPPKTINYRVEPKLAATTKGQGGKEDAAGITIPVIISGPWHNVSYKPDIGAMAKEKVMETIKDKLPIPGASGGSTGGTSTSPLPTNPLKGLFGK